MSEFERAYKSRDKHIDRLNSERSKGGCRDKAAAIIAIGITVGWAFSEVIDVVAG